MSEILKRLDEVPDSVGAEEAAEPAREASEAGQGRPELGLEWVHGDGSVPEATSPVEPVETVSAQESALAATRQQTEAGAEETVAVARAKASEDPGEKPTPVARKRPLLGLVSSSRPESGFEPGKKPAPARFETQDRSIAEPAAEPKPGISLEESEAPRRRGGLFWPLLGLSLLAGAGYAVYTAYRFAVESPTPQASSSPSGGAESRDPDAQKYEAAAALLARGQAALALGAFEELARRHPNDASVLLGLAIAQQRKPDNAKTDGARVEETLLAAMKASPGNPAVLNNLGIFYARVGKLEAAVQLLTQARDLEPARAEPLLNLALAYELGEDWKSALRFYETYLVHPARDPSLIKAVADRLQKIEPFSRSQRLIEDEDALDGGWDDSLDGEDFARGKEAKR